MVHHAGNLFSSLALHNPGIASGTHLSPALEFVKAGGPEVQGQPWKPNSKRSGDDLAPKVKEEVFL